MRNYFKVFDTEPGDGREFIGEQHFFFFDGLNLEDTMFALGSAMAVGKANVYKRTMFVPPDVPQIGVFASRPIRGAATVAEVTAGE